MRVETDEPEIVERIAALDVGKAEVVCCVRVPVRAVTAPTMIICQEGDTLHPVELGRILADIMPNSELIVLGSEGEMMARLPELVAKVAVFLAADG